MDPCGRLRPTDRLKLRQAVSWFKSGMDEELNSWPKERLVEEVIKLRNGIRKHRDASGHELCWHHPALWGLLPEKTDPLPAVPDWSEFMEGCIRYRQSLDPHAQHPAKPD
jgi:hypothetical protein